jgi:riboflavin kinase / FMN adenylyltransferase
MRIYDDLAHVELERDTILTIGAFDGVHRGHQHLIEQMAAEAVRTGRLTALLTFHPHPNTVLFPNDPTKYLTTPGQKAAILERLGLDVLVILPFDRGLAATSGYDFIQRIVGPLRAKEIWVGSDFALGRGRGGDVAHLKQWGNELGFTARAVPPFLDDGAIVSSTRIRALIRDGDMPEVARMLNRYYSLAGEVVHGAGRGRRILDIPTANLDVRINRAIPLDGIYAVFVVLGEERYKGVASIGRRPTFDNGNRTIEVHILDFDQDIYGCDLVVEFVRWLRPEARYEKLDDLIVQIRLDIRQSVEVLEREVAYPQIVIPIKCQPMRHTNSGPIRFEELPYTADVGLRAYGRDLRDLFVNAAYGMFSLVSELDGLVATTLHSIDLTANDRELLLLEWLDELLFLHDTTHEVLICFDIENLTDTHLRAHVQGTHLAQLKREIKAVTYHDLKVEQTPEGYTATVVFDI